MMKGKIKELLDVAGFTDATKEQIEQSFIGAKNAPDFKEMYVKHFNWEEFEKMVIPFYEEHFSIEEIENILTFYTSPIGEKILKFNESGSSDMNGKLDEWVKKSYNDMMVEMAKNKEELYKTKSDN